MKTLISCIGFILVIISALSTPISIGYFLFHWADGYDVSVAAWEGFKLWVLMLLAILPGFVCIQLGD